MHQPEDKGLSAVFLGSLLQKSVVFTAASDWCQSITVYCLLSWANYRVTPYRETVCVIVRQQKLNVSNYSNNYYQKNPIIQVLVWIMTDSLQDSAE